MSKKKQKQPTSSSAGKSTIGIISKEDQLAMIRGARRKSNLATGVDASAQGTGPWGGTKRQQRRRNRRQAIEQAKQLEED